MGNNIELELTQDWNTTTLFNNGQNMEGVQEIFVELTAGLRDAFGDPVSWGVGEGVVMEQRINDDGNFAEPFPGMLTVTTGKGVLILDHRDPDTANLRVYYQGPVTNGVQVDVTDQLLYAKIYVSGPYQQDIQAVQLALYQVEFWTDDIYEITLS